MSKTFVTESLKPLFKSSFIYVALSSGKVFVDLFANKSVEIWVFEVKKLFLPKIDYNNVYVKKDR